jgi:hypothetical protein
MENYTEEELEYHTDLIMDMIRFKEGETEALQLPIEEHIDLIIACDAQMSMLSGTEDIVEVEEYKKLYDQSEILVHYLAEIYQKNGYINVDVYYNFCKIIQRMIEILSNDTGASKDDIELLFQKMKV